jgi:hypothetical protein
MEELDTPVDTAKAAAEPATPAASRKSWTLVTVGGVLCGLLVLGFLWRPMAPVEQSAQATLAAPIAVATPAALPSAPVVAVAETSSVSQPLASRAPRAASSPLASVSQHAKPKAMAAAPAEVSQPIVPRDMAPAVASQGSQPGPSLPGQACADRVFIFKIACIAEQCATERYRQTRECIRFKEMERSGEEQRNNRR